MPIQILMLALISIFHPAIASGQAQTCLDNAETQPAINRCLQLEHESADQELNRVYQSILRKHADNPNFLQKLKLAQRAWIHWRDAELAAIFPESTEKGFYGSSLPGCQNTHLATLTRQRMQQLRQWLDGVEEGDICSGSFPFKPSSTASESNP